jgi:diguanylate cyclase (GGDEF)-like protein
MFNSLTVPISTRTGEFENHRAETVFIRSQLHKTQAQLRSTMLFCSCFYLAFSVTDVGVLGYGHDALMLFMVRMTVALVAASGCLLTYHKPDSVAVTRLVASATEIVGMLAFLLIVRARPAEQPWHAMSMALMLIVVYLYIPNRLVYSLAIAAAETGGFIAMVVIDGRLAPAELLTMTMLLLLANTFGFVAARRYNVLWREEFRAQSILKNLSIRDPLTGCYNRQYLQQELFEPELARAERFEQRVTVIMCDLDNFKSINDRCGHGGGDLVLTEFARLLHCMTRDGVDSVVRYGGEEFLLVLPETDLEGGTKLAERLRRSFAETTILNELDATINTTASFGVATVNLVARQSPWSLRELISHADKLLYSAKASGRNQVMAGLLA